MESYKKAVQLVPDLLSWRLGLARAYFDVLDYLSAHDEVQSLLKKLPPGSPLKVPAENLLSIIYGSGKDRGRRYTRIYTPDATAEQLKEWALIRASAWELFSTGKYAEAEPIYRKLLALNPRDATAAHQLGLSLMELGRCEEALPFFRLMSSLDSTDEEQADTVFRIGLCLVELEQWTDALVHFQILYEAAVEFEEANKHVDLPPDARVLSKKKMAEWIEKVRPHVPEADRLKSKVPSKPKGMTLDELYEKLAAEPRKPENPLDERASLMGRDADFSWFRYVIPAKNVMRDDFPTGEHVFIPIDPIDSFDRSQREIYLVFRLVSASYDEVPLAAQCFLEATETTEEPRGSAQDQVIMSMNDQSGYFVLSPPEGGWSPGLYRCGLFVGEQLSADTQVDEVRFLIHNAPLGAAPKFAVRVS
ncbi:MAG: tetratricopeptide repeat protein [Proteobacteria bacterium]|nr:tetratricopeptide repeat protein [Pseudomonadota bacterium]